MIETSRKYILKVDNYLLYVIDMPIGVSRRVSHWLNALTSVALVVLSAIMLFVFYGDGADKLVDLIPRKTVQTQPQSALDKLQVDQNSQNTSDGSGVVVRPVSQDSVEYAHILLGKIIEWETSIIIIETDIGRVSISESLDGVTERITLSNGSSIAKPILEPAKTKYYLGKNVSIKVTEMNGQVIANEITVIGGSFNGS